MVNKMNQFFSLRIATVLCGCVALLLLIVSCGDKEDNPFTNGINVNSVIAQYEVIGQEHNDMLALFYAQHPRGRSAADCADYFNAFFGVTNSDKIITLSRQGRSDEDVTGLVSAMVSDALISTKAAGYIQRVELVLNHPTMGVEEMQAAITEIQRQVIPLLKDNELDQFMAYAETAKASLTFWDENYDALEEFAGAENYGISARSEGHESNRSPRNIFRRIAMAAASDAAGAAAGAAFGASIAGSINGVTNATGAAVGAAIAGAASSAAGWNSRNLSVIIPASQIREALERR